MKNPDFFVPPGGQPRDDAIAMMREVCVLASTAIRLSRDRFGPVDDVDDDDLHDRIQLMRQALGRIGWVADVAMRKMGDAGVFATAEDWMLPGV